MAYRLLIAGLCAAGLGIAAEKPTKPAGIAAEKPTKPAGTLQAFTDDGIQGFLETASSAGRFEVEAGQLAQRLGTSPEVKTFGDRVATDHRKAAAELQKVAVEKGVVLNEALLQRHQAMLDELEDEKPGQEFDDAFRRAMIASHKEAISLFEESARQSADQDVRSFAAKTLPVLQHHGSLAEQLPKS